MNSSVQSCISPSRSAHPQGLWKGLYSSCCLITKFDLVNTLQMKSCSLGMKNVTYSSVLSLLVSYSFLGKEGFPTSMLGKGCLKGSPKALWQMEHRSWELVPVLPFSPRPSSIKLLETPCTSWKQEASYHAQSLTLRSTGKNMPSAV